MVLHAFLTCERKTFTRRIRCNPNRIIAHCSWAGEKQYLKKEEWFASCLILWYILSSHHGLAFASFTKDRFNFFWWLILKSCDIKKQKQCNPCACLPMHCTKVLPKNCRALNFDECLFLCKTRIMC